MSNDAILRWVFLGAFVLLVLMSFAMNEKSYEEK